MSCCGKKREEFTQYNNAANNVSIEHGASKTKADVHFEYTGETGLTVIGSVTRNRYRFNGTSDVQAVDYRDASGMMAVPMVKRVKA